MGHLQTKDQQELYWKIIVTDYISGVGEGNPEANGTGLGGNGLIVLKY
jgi:hypothetical protein